jgi:catechol O-methyltransferase
MPPSFNISGLVKYIDNLPAAKIAEIQGKPQKVLDEIDAFIAQGNSLMNIGPIKGGDIVKRLHKYKPKVAIELGGFMGYSAILFASHLPEDGKLYSFEANEQYAKIAQKHIDLAGLSHKVQIILGEAQNTLPEFKKTHNYDKIDFVFLDHWKDRYVPDLRVLESLELVKPGTFIAADNIRPESEGGPRDYSLYVEATPQEKKAYIATHENDAGSQFPGRWDLIYESDKFHGPRDAVEYSDVKGYAK